MNNEAINEKRVEELIGAITLYTNQLEDYDKSNFNTCMTCIGFVGGLIAVVGAILCTSSNNNNNIFLNEAVSVVLLLIPLIVTLFLYNFSMNCRRSALFSGYVQFLEECLNKEFGRKDMLYSNYVIPKYYARFAVNKYGPIAMSLFLLFLYYFSFRISLIFANRSVNKDFITVYKCGWVILLVFCTVFDTMYVISLARNNKIMEKVKEDCMNKNEMN